MSADPRLRYVRLLTGSQDLYGTETLDQVDRQSEEIRRQLAEILSVAVVGDAALTTSASIQRAVHEVNADHNCIGVIAWMHTFSPAKMWIHGIDALGKPLLHLHTQVNRSLPWSTIDMDFMNLNQAAHGDREFGYLQSRLGTARKTVAGHLSDRHTQDRIHNWVRAAEARAALVALRVARFGDNMRGVAVTEGDKVEVERRLGASVNTFPVTELAAAVAAAGPALIDDVVADILDRSDVVAELRPGGDQHASLRYAARLEVGLRSLLSAGGFGAFTTNFEDLGDLRQLPGLAVQRLMADGFGFGAEGDWKTAVLTVAAARLADSAVGPPRVSFMEDYTYHFGPGPAKILGAHMLEVSPAIASGRPRCEIHPLSIGGREAPVRLVFDAEPGRAMTIGLLDLGDRLRIVANEVEVVPPDEPLERLPTARAVWLPAPDLSTSAECWLTAGGPHHTVLAYGVTREALTDLARIVGCELVVIGDDTTIDGLRDRLRWNEAAYRLANGRPVTQ